MNTYDERWNPGDRDDPAGSALAPLRTLEWKNTVHQSRLERELQKGTHMQTHRSWKQKAAMLTGIFLAGGIAGATGLALVERFLVEETDLEGPETHVRVTDTESGAVVMDENIQDGDGLFHITEDEDGEEGPFLIVRPVTEPDPEEGGDTPAETQDAKPRR